MIINAIRNRLDRLLETLSILINKISILAFHTLIFTLLLFTFLNLNSLAVFCLGDSDFKIISHFDGLIDQLIGLILVLLDYFIALVWVALVSIHASSTLDHPIE
jgi:hypothetical protein